MSYLSRAQSFVERGEIMRAFYQLVNGLQRNPHDERALDLLVDLYIGDFDSPGVERDLLVVLGVVPQGIDIYEMIYASLEQSGDERRLKSLVQTRERENLLPQDPEPAHLEHHHPLDARGSGVEEGLRAISGPRHAQFSGAQDAPQSDGQWHLAPSDERPYHADDDYDVLAYDLEQPNPARGGHNLDIHSAPTKSLDAVTAPQSAVKNIDGRPVKSSTSETSYGDGSAMDGVFSSIDIYLDEEHQELRQELADRSKNRFLWVGLGVIIIITFLIFAYPTQDSTNASTNTAGENTPAAEDGDEGPKIDEPIDDAKR